MAPDGHQVFVSSKVLDVQLYPLERSDDIGKTIVAGAHGMSGAGQGLNGKETEDVEPEVGSDVDDLTDAGELTAGNHDAGRGSAEGIGTDEHNDRQRSFVHHLRRVDVQIEAILGAVEDLRGVQGATLETHLRAIVRVVGAVPAVLNLAQLLRWLPASVVHGRHGVRYTAENEGVLLEQTLD